MKTSRLILAAAALALTMTFAGCGKGNSADNPNPDDQNSNGITNTVPDGYTPIRTAADLDAVRDSLSGNYILMNDISLVGRSRAGAGWTPIGTYDTPFTGTFDGNGHKISGLIIQDTTLMYVGLFGCMSGGSVSNLGVEIDAGGLNSGNDVGGIVGCVTSSKCTITNCYTTGNISVISYPDHSNLPRVGGIVGNLYSGTIANCHTAGNISSGSGYIGGITGYKGQNSTIIDCYSTGNISFITSGGDCYSGGITGEAYGTISNCYSTGNISVSITSTSGAAYSGGIAGEAYGTISNCYSTGEISASTVSPGSIYTPAGAWAGGIVGLGQGNSTITNCYSTGYIKSTASNVSYAYSTQSYSGGIVGAAQGGTITGCAAINQTIVASTSAGVDVTGCFAAGRIVGYASSYYVPIVSNNFALNPMTVSATGMSYGTTLITGTLVSYDGTGKTLAQLQAQSTYADPVNGDGLGGLGWAFGNDDANPWKMPASGGYPTLYWQ